MAPIKVAKIADTQIDKIIATGIENAPKLYIFIKSDCRNNPKV